MARAALQWSLVQLQEKTGISKNTLLRFETGGGVHYNTALKIEEAFLREGIVFTSEADDHGPGIILPKDLRRSSASVLTRVPKPKSGKRSQK
jgi:hypothetical protein